MSGFTHKNLMDVEDSAVKFGYSPALESRFARGDLETERVGLSYQRIAPDTRAPFGHHHGSQEEIYVILSGGGRAKLDDEIVELKPLDALRVAPDVTRAFGAGPEGDRAAGVRVGNRRNAGRRGRPRLVERLEKNAGPLRGRRLRESGLRLYPV